MRTKPPTCPAAAAAASPASPALPACPRVGMAAGNHVREIRVGGLVYLFLWACSLFSTTLYGVPFPLPTPEGRRVQQLKTRPECWNRGFHEASTKSIEATSANFFRKECLGMQRSPKAMLLRPTNVDLPECYCHLLTMVSAGMRSRPV